MARLSVLNLGQAKESKSRKDKLKNGFLKVLAFFREAKKKIVYRLFWGRSSSYKKLSHFIFFVLTATILITGFSAKLTYSNKTNVIASSTANPGNIDLLEQGSDVQTILLAETTGNFKVTKYKVKSGDIIEDLSTKYGVTIETIKASNIDKIDYYTQLLKEGDDLLIPEINGVILTVKDGDTLDSLMGKLKKGNKTDVIEINRLEPPDYKVSGLSYIFVPDGEITPPPKPVPETIYAYAPSNVVFGANADVSALNGISFSDPLSTCPGYGWSRGVSSWHNGVDLTGTYGCEVRASASGKIIFSGWEPQGGGLAVTIDHGNGVHTLYFHNSSLVYPVGTYVQQGQIISYMGCTGLCTGTHLHLSLRINYIYVDPAPYVPYWRP